MAYDDYEPMTPPATPPPVRRGGTQNKHTSETTTTVSKKSKKTKKTTTHTMTASQEQTLRGVLQNRKGRMGVDRILHAARRIDPTVTRAQVSKYMSSESAPVDNVGQIYSSAKIARKDFLPITARPNTVQMDLFFMPKYAKQNKNVTGGLSMIDMNTRQAVVVPIKSKRSETTKKQDVDDPEMVRSVKTAVKAIEAMKEQSNEGTKQLDIDGGQTRAVKQIFSDSGNEFLSSKMKQFYKDADIKHLPQPPYRHRNTSMVESFHRTLKRGLNRHMEEAGNVKWTEGLPGVMDEYNDDYHSSIKRAPNEMDGFLENWNSVKSWMDNVKAKRRLQGSKGLQPGDTVRKMKKVKDAFNKEGRNWSKTLYTVGPRWKGGWAIDPVDPASANTAKLNREKAHGLAYGYPDTMLMRVHKQSSNLHGRDVFKKAAASTQADKEGEELAYEGKPKVNRALTARTLRSQVVAPRRSARLRV